MLTNLLSSNRVLRLATGYTLPAQVCLFQLTAGLLKKIPTYQKGWMRTKNKLTTLYYSYQPCQGKVEAYTIVFSAGGMLGLRPPSKHLYLDIHELTLNHVAHTGSACTRALNRNHGSR